MPANRRFPSIKGMPADLISPSLTEVSPSIPIINAELPQSMAASAEENDAQLGGNVELPAFQELAGQMLTRRHYINSKTAYPISEEYLNRLRAISKIANIPISNVINNIFFLFFDSAGILNPTNAAIKKVFLANSNDTLKEYLGSARPVTKKQ